MIKKTTVLPRRDWIMAALRYSAVGGLGWLAWSLAARQESCFRFALPCRDCGLLAACQEPRAQNVKAQNVKAQHDEQPGYLGGAVMSEPQTERDRRRFIGDGLRVAGLAAVGVAGGFFMGRQGRSGETRWQLDPNRCIACDNCATHCVLEESAVKCVQFFDMCGYCEICTGYFDPDYQALDTAAENQMCPTGALVRSFVEEKAGQKFFEYTVDLSGCIGCGKCVKGCALMNGSLYLQVNHDRCLNCNECAIAVECPTQAFERVPVEEPYRLKEPALALLKRKAKHPRHQDARDLLEQVHEP